MNITNLLEIVNSGCNEYYSDFLSLNVGEMHVVVVGYGSIGKRIASLLDACGARVSIISRHGGSQVTVSNRVDKSHMSADMVVVATETSDHIKQLKTLYDLDYQGLIYVEKPLVSSLEEINMIQDEFSKSFTKRMFCGYNFRYHLLTEIVSRFIARLGTDSMFIQYTYNENVKTWNNSIPWHTSYATSPNGGGAILTLSHAIDQLRYMIGEPIKFEQMIRMPPLLNTASNEGVVAKVNSTGKLQSIIGILEIGFHSYPGVHSICINTACASIEADFKREELRIGDPEKRTVSIMRFEDLRDLSIRKSLTTLLVTKHHSCNFIEAAATIGSCELLSS